MSIHHPHRRLEPGAYGGILVVTAGAGVAAAISLVLRALLG